MCSKRVFGQEGIHKIQGFLENCEGTFAPSRSARKNAMSRNLTVKAVVDAVDDVFRSRLLGGESALVLLDHILLSRGKSWDGVKIGNRLVWSVGHNLSGGTRVHTGHTKVSTDIGVVDINDGSSSEFGNVLVINLGVGNGRDGSGTDGGGGSKEGTTVALGVEGSLGRGLRVGCERSSGTASKGV